MANKTISNILKKTLQKYDIVLISKTVGVEAFKNRNNMWHFEETFILLMIQKSTRNRFDVVFRK